MDIFAGSNTTGAAAENLGRKWMAFEFSQEYLAASAFRFLGESTEAEIRALYAKLASPGSSDTALPQPDYQQRLTYL